VVVNAPVLQFIKTVYTPSSITRFLPTDCLGCHRYLRWLGTCPPYASRDWVLPH
jgi:hypothetical protein